MKVLFLIRITTALAASFFGGYTVGFGYIAPSLGSSSSFANAGSSSFNCGVGFPGFDGFGSSNAFANAVSSLFEFG